MKTKKYVVVINYCFYLTKDNEDTKKRCYARLFNTVKEAREKITELEDNGYNEIFEIFEMTVESELTVGERVENDTK